MKFSLFNEFWTTYSILIQFKFPDQTKATNKHVSEIWHFAIFALVATPDLHEEGNLSWCVTFKNSRQHVTVNESSPQSDRRYPNREKSCINSITWLYKHISTSWDVKSEDFECPYISRWVINISNILKLVSWSFMCTFYVHGSAKRVNILDMHMLGEQSSCNLYEQVVIAIIACLCPGQQILQLLHVLGRCSVHPSSISRICCNQLLTTQKFCESHNDDVISEWGQRSPNPYLANQSCPDEFNLVLEVWTREDVAKLNTFWGLTFSKLYDSKWPVVSYWMMV